MSELDKELETVEVGPSPEAAVEDIAPATDPLPEQAHFDEASAALDVYKQQMKLFMEALDAFPGSRRQLERSWANAALSPLNDKPLEWSYEAEKELFDIYIELNSAKFILMVHGLQDAGVLKLYKPLMQSTAATPSELALKEKMRELTDGPVIELGERELSKALEVEAPPTETL